MKNELSSEPESEIALVYRKLTSIGFTLDPSEKRIDLKNVLHSFLVQSGLHLQGFEEVENESPDAAHQILYAMKSYAAGNFDIRNITRGTRASFVLNQNKHKVRWGNWDEFGYEMMSDVNKALKKENIPFRWIGVEGKDFAASSSYSDSLLYLPMTVIAGLSREFKEASDLFFEYAFLPSRKAITAVTPPGFDFSSKMVFGYKEDTLGNIPEEMTFHFDAECIDEPEDYRSLLEGALALIKDKPRLENIIIRSLEGTDKCEVIITVAGKKIRASLEASGWVDQVPFMDLINSVSEELGGEATFIELKTKDQSMMIAYISESQFSQYEI